MSKEKPGIPDWAQQERLADLAWISQYLEAFWVAASFAYRQSGRGAIVVDTTTQMPGAGHPFGYVKQIDFEALDDADTQRILREYEPASEFVVLLWKTGDRTSTYRVRSAPSSFSEDDSYPE